MPITDDNSLVSSYIRTIENPDSIGFVNNRWYRSPYDANARGFGVDVVYNDTAKKITEGREGKYLTVDEEREIRNNYIDKLQETIDRKHLPNFSKGNISPRKRTMATGLLYRGDGINTNPELKKAYYEGTDKDFQNAVSKYYKAKHLPERARLHDEFWKEYDYNTFVGPRQASPETFKAPSTLPNIRKDGGQIENKDTWDKLSMRDKAAMIQTAVSNGIYNLSDIKKSYNEFVEDGPTEENRVLDLSDRGYRSKEDLKITGTPPLAFAGKAASAIENLLQGSIRKDIAKKGAQYLKPVIRYAEEKIHPLAGKAINYGYTALVKPIIEYGQVPEELGRASLQDTGINIMAHELMKKKSFGGPIIQYANTHRT